MRIGVIADTHIPDRAKDIPKAVLKDFEKVDLVVHAGDLVELSVLERLKTVCPDIRAVWGNMDPYEVRKKLPEKEIIEIGIYRIGVVHGYGHPARLMDLTAEIFKDDRVDLIIYGHSHSASLEKRGKFIYFNPGSPTDTIFAPYRSYGIIDIDKQIEPRIIRMRA